MDKSCLYLHKEIGPEGPAVELHCYLFFASHSPQERFYRGTNLTAGHTGYPAHGTAQETNSQLLAGCAQD